MKENIIKNALTSQEVNELVSVLLCEIKANSFPQMRLQNNGEHRQLTEKELELSSELVFNR